MIQTCNAYGFVYMTTNLINGKKYIGKKKYSGNWKTYLGSGIALTAAVEKYGRRNFERKIIENCYSEEELNERECFWIDHYGAIDSDEFYNIAPGGDGGFVKKGFAPERLLESETRRIQKVIEECHKRFGEKSPTSKLKESDVIEIIQRLLKKEFISDIARDYGVSYKTIWDIHHHSTWTHLTNGITFPPIINRKRKWGKSVQQLSLSGEAIGTYKSARDASLATGADYKKISACCLGRRQSTHGFRWQFS